MLNLMNSDILKLNSNNLERFQRFARYLKEFNNQMKKLTLSDLNGETKSMNDENLLGLWSCWNFETDTHPTYSRLQTVIGATGNEINMETLSLGDVIFSNVTQRMTNVTLQQEEFNVDGITWKRKNPLYDYSWVLYFARALSQVSLLESKKFIINLYLQMKKINYHGTLN